MLHTHPKCAHRESDLKTSTVTRVQHRVVLEWIRGALKVTSIFCSDFWV